jgi:hypothetical protein
MSKLIFLLIFVVVSAFAGDNPQHIYFTPGKIGLEWHFQDEYRVWLSVNSYAHDYDFNASGWNPSFVYLRCTYMPIVKRMKDGSYQITFVSELTQAGEGIP